MTEYMRYDWSDFNEKYGKSFIISSKEIAAFILEKIRPKNIIDVGCGNGTLLNAFQEFGIRDILGVDGPWIDKNCLVIDKDKFLSHDLQKPLSLTRRFDLVVSLEVAEHLPEDKAHQFVKMLTDLGPVVMFAAAVPFQGGNKHVNEQWPDYWRDLFSQRGYVIIDCLRQEFWDNPKVKWWMAQNMFLYVKKNSLSLYPELEPEFKKGLILPLQCIHPSNYLQKMNIPIRRQVKQILKTVKKQLIK